MNERIKELAEQSFDITKDNRDRVEYSADSYGIEKFAELIIQECATMFTMTHADEQYPRRIDKTILKHFGITE
jgi:hypothetical protein